jgi:hypothetical protein
MNRRRVYIAGPISKGDLCHNINQATDAFVELSKAGLAPFCPHWSAYSKPAEWKMVPNRFTRNMRQAVVCEATIQGNDQMQHADWLGVDLAWVSVSDAVLRLPGESIGADAEVAMAVVEDIPVFHSVAEVIEWDRREFVTDSWAKAGTS